MLKLYQGRLSVCAIKVRLVLAEKGIGWEPVNLNLRNGDQHRPDYLKLNPNGVVPTLVHGDRVVIESSVIMQYLDEIHPEPPLQPDDAMDRVRMRLWMKRVDEAIHPGSAALTYALVHGKEMRRKSPHELEAYYRGIPNPATRARQRAAIEQGMDSPDVLQALKHIDRAFADMDAQLGQSAWLAGEAWSLADAAMTPYVNRLGMLGLSPLWSPSRANVVDWFGRIQARPSYQEAVRAYETEADLKPFADLDGWVWPKAQSLLDAA